MEIGEDLALLETNVADPTEMVTGVPLDLYSIASSGNLISWHIPMPIRPTSVTHCQEFSQK
jgi:hypothetical protein